MTLPATAAEVAAKVNPAAREGGRLGRYGEGSGVASLPRRKRINRVGGQAVMPQGNGLVPCRFPAIGIRALSACGATRACYALWAVHGRLRAWTEKRMP